MKSRPFSHLKLLAIFSLSVLPAIATPKIGVLLMDRGFFWSTVEKGVTEASQGRDAEFIIKAPTMANAPEQQLKLLNVLQQEKLDALIIGALPSEGLRQPLTQLMSMGVKVVSLDLPLPAGLSQSHIGVNQKVMAEAAAHTFAAAIKEGDPIAMLRANSLEKVSAREKAFLTTIKELCPKSTVYADVMAGAVKGDEYVQCVELLTRHPDIKAVCTPFTGPTLAMIKAIKDKHLEGKIIHIGFGTGLPPEAVDALESGTTQFWIAQLPKFVGAKAVEVALDLINGKTVPASIDVEYAVVTKANLHDPKIEALRND